MNIDDFRPEEVEWCEMCRPHRSNHCDGCSGRFLDAETRYRSQSFHFHPASIGGIAGTHAIHKTLCVECYRKDHAAVFKSPPPPLPDRGVDAKFFAMQQLQQAREKALGILRRSLGSEVNEETKKALEQLVSAGAGRA